MPPLLHGLGYRPELSSDSKQSSHTETLRKAHEADTPAATIVSTADTAVKVSLKAHSQKFSTGVLDDKATTASEAIDDTTSSTDVSQRRKRTPRVVFTLSGPSPFPDRVGPTAAACQQVYDLLSAKHDKREMPANVPPPSQTVAGCGEVNFVLEALLRTIISTHTHMSNADKAIKNVCEHYPVFQHGDFVGSVDWNVVRTSGAEKLEEAIRPAGKAKTTSAAILSILDSVKHENDQRRESLVNGTIVSEPQQCNLLSRAEILRNRADEMLLTAQDFLTLDYLHTMPAQAVFERLQLFPGVGVKTAACILLFCFQYPAFAVDTHVWRLCKLLDWAPTTASRDQTFFHLDPVVPDGLKYGLHQLFIAHGKACVRCSGRSKKSDDLAPGEACVLEDLVTRDNLINKELDKKKVNGKKRGSKKRSLHDRDEDDSASSSLPTTKSNLVTEPDADQTEPLTLREGMVRHITKHLVSRSETQGRSVLNGVDLDPTGDVRRSKRIAALTSIEGIRLET